MDENLKLMIYYLLPISGYIYAMYLGRQGKTKEWPHSKETTISVSILLMCQWIYICLHASGQNSLEEQKKLIELGLIVLVLIPMIVMLLWSRINMLVRKILNSGENTQAYHNYPTQEDESNE